VLRRSSPAEPVGPQRLGRAVLTWFLRNQRPLPWRRTRDPYRTWVAEVLLQQTRVEQAVPYFERFLARFPDVRALAAARSAEVLKLWQGAGYYARARRLHVAAGQIVARYDGTIPRSVEELERLPGVGPYTARAVAAIAFGVRVVPVDANVLRVAARWTREERNVDLASVRASLVTFLERAAPADAPGGFAEALMELGETICRPRAPRCESCPAAFGCRATRELDDPGTLPARAGRPPRPHVRAAVVAVARGDRWFVQRRPAEGLLGGLWEFPGGKIERGESAPAAARRELREETGMLAGPLRAVAVVRHGYSHFTVDLHVFRTTARQIPAASSRRRWATLDEIGRLPLPRATEKVVAVLRSGRGRLGTVTEPRPGQGSAGTGGPWSASRTAATKSRTANGRTSVARAPSASASRRSPSRSRGRRTIARSSGRTRRPSVSSSRQRSAPETASRT